MSSETQPPRPTSELSRPSPARMRPERFTPEEPDWFSYPIAATTPQLEGKAWARKEQSGGIGGRLRGIHADHLRPLERVVEAFLHEWGRTCGTKR
ncbi:MAG: hypothetical protein HY319_28030 [Armatimonadetes bacterium]|nr:hypothetical protein [Armatimonadota bacterium]